MSVTVTDQSKDDATIEEAKRADVFGNDVATANRILALCDIATRRGEERDKAKADAQETYEAIDCGGAPECKTPEDPCWEHAGRNWLAAINTLESERDALAEELARQREMAEGHPAMCCGQCDASVKALTEEIKRLRR